MTPNSTAPEQLINGFGMLGGDALGPHIYTSDQLQLGDTLSIEPRRSVARHRRRLAHEPRLRAAGGESQRALRLQLARGLCGEHPAPLSADLCDREYAISGSMRELEMFASGKLPLGKKLDVTAGLRWAGQWNPQPGNIQTRLFRNAADSIRSAQWQPRLGFAWTPCRRPS